MSGRKCSDFRLQREREEKLRLLQSVNSLRDQVGELQKEIRQQLSRLSAGLRETFAADVERAKRWLDVVHSKTDQFNADTATSQLNDVLGKLDRTCSDGRRIHEELAVTVTQKADDLGRRLAGEMATAKGAYLGLRALMGLWFGDVQNQVDKAFAEAAAMLETEQYSRLKTVLDETQRTVKSAGDQAIQLEDKHQKRLYLLKALRQVCADMGMRESAAPQFEQEGQRGSRIRFEVDSINQGQIKFDLALDGISSFADADQKHCFHDFAKLSNYLEEEFGINTSFRTEDGQELPKDIQKGERDLPSDNDMEANR